MGSFKRVPCPLPRRGERVQGCLGECAWGGGHGEGRRVALGPRFSPPPWQRRWRGGHGRDAVGASGRATAQRAPRPLAAGTTRLEGAEAPSGRGRRPADPTPAHRRLLAALPARPGFRSGPGLAGKCAPGRIHGSRAWRCGCSPEPRVSLLPFPQKLWFRPSGWTSLCPRRSPGLGKVEMRKLSSNTPE